MRRLHAGDAFRGGQEAEEFDIVCPRLFEQVNRRNTRIASGQHRIDGDNNAVLQVIGHFEVILHRLKGLFIPVKPYKPHPC